MTTGGSSSNPVRLPDAVPWLREAAMETMLPGSPWQSELQPAIGWRVVQMLAPQLVKDVDLFDAVSQRLGADFATKYLKLQRSACNPKSWKSETDLAIIDEQAKALLEWCTEQVLREMPTAKATTSEEAEADRGTHTLQQQRYLHSMSPMSDRSQALRQSVTAATSMVSVGNTSTATDRPDAVRDVREAGGDPGERNAGGRAVKRLPHRQFNVPDAVAASEPRAGTSVSAASVMATAGTMDKFKRHCKSAVAAAMDRTLAEHQKPTSTEDALAQHPAEKTPVAHGRTPSDSSGLKSGQPQESVSTVRPARPPRIETQALSPAVIECLRQAPHCLPSVCKRLGGKLLPPAIRWDLWVCCLMHRASANTRTKPSVAQSTANPTSTSGRHQRPPFFQPAGDGGGTRVKDAVGSEWFGFMPFATDEEFVCSDALLGQAVGDFSALLVEGRKKLGLAEGSCQSPNATALASALDHAHQTVPALSWEQVARHAESSRETSLGAKHRRYCLEVLNLLQIASCRGSAGEAGGGDGVHRTHNGEYSMDAALTSLLVTVMAESPSAPGTLCTQVAAIVHLLQTAVLPSAGIVRLVALDIATWLRDSEAELFASLASVLQLSTPRQLGLSLSLDKMTGKDLTAEMTDAKLRYVRALLTKWLTEVFTSLLGKEALLFSWDQLLLGQFSVHAYHHLATCFFSLLRDDLSGIQTVDDLKQVLHNSPAIITLRKLYRQFSHTTSP